MQGENDPAMAEGKEGPFLSRAERVVVHARAPDMASRLARQSVIDGAGEDLGTERQQDLEDAVAEVIEVPAGLAEEAVKGAEVFEAAQLPGLNHARKRTAARAKDPCTGQRPKGGEAWPGKAGLKGEQKGSKGTDEEIGIGAFYSFTYVLKDTEINKTPQRFLRSSSRSTFRPDICFRHF